MNDVEMFGRTLKKQRLSLQLSQESVATLAFGNGDRKSYISNIENGHLPSLRPETVRRIAEAVDLSIEQVPVALRWPLLGETYAGSSIDYDNLHSKLTEQIEVSHQARKFMESWSKDLVERVKLSPMDRYKNQLRNKLDRLADIFGSPFSTPNFCICITASFLYLFFAGLIAYAKEGGGVGTLRVFNPPAWAIGFPSWILATAAGVVILITSYLGYRWGRPRRRDISFRELGNLGRLWQIHFVRVLCGGTLLGGAAAVASVCGVDAIAAIMVMATIGFGALSVLGTKRATLAGMIAGALAGGTESFLDNPTFLETIEGVLFGLILCGTAGFVSAEVSSRLKSRHTGTFMSAGVGAVAGASATLLFFAALEWLSINDFIDRVFLDTGFALISSANDGFIILATTWVIFPITNAVMDFISYGVSFILARRALRNRARIEEAIKLGMIDLIAASFLSLATLSVVYGGLLILDFGVAADLSPKIFFQEWWNNPFGNGIWLTIMILSTLVWTLLHYVIVVLPVISAQLASGALYNTTKEEINENLSNPGNLFISYKPMLAFFAIYIVLIFTSILISNIAVSILF